MARIVIAYATGDGQTGRIAQRISEVLGRQGHDALCVNLGAAAPPPIESFDAVLVGAPVRFGKHHKNAIAFCRANASALRYRPSAFFSVSLSAHRDTPGARREVAKALAHLLGATGWVPPRIVTIAGALLYTKYGFVLRRVMRLIAVMAGHDTDMSRDFEYTDWAAVEAFARDFAAGLLAPAAARPAA